MYNTEIQTTLSVRGHVVHIEYEVTKEWAVEWWLNPGAYDDDIGERLLDTLLRTHEDAWIRQQLLSEFESRQYAMEQALAAKTAEEDIPF